MRRHLPLFQRLRLLLDRRSGFVGRRRLLFSRGRHLLRTMLRVRRRTFGLQRGGQDVIAALGKTDHFGA